MGYYRIDNRCLNNGDIIDPQNKYQRELNVDKSKVEAILEQNRPDNKPKRNSILMIFESYQDAKSHWTRQKNSTFYKVQIDENDILHIGDYNKLDEIFKNIDNEEISNNIASEYWKSNESENPITEIFVSKATVTEIISNSEEDRRNELIKRWKLF